MVCHQWNWWRSFTLHKSISHMSSLSVWQGTQPISPIKITDKITAFLGFIAACPLYQTKRISLLFIIMSKMLVSQQLENIFRCKMNVSIKASHWYGCSNYSVIYCFLIIQWNWRNMFKSVCIISSNCLFSLTNSAEITKGNQQHLESWQWLLRVSLVVIRLSKTLFFLSWSWLNVSTNQLIPITESSTGELLNIFINFLFLVIYLCYIDFSIILFCKQKS